jgi:hypothetical protein
MAARISLETLTSKIAPAHLIPRLGFVMEFAGRRLTLAFPASFSLAMVKNTKMPKSVRKAAAAPAQKRKKSVDNLDTQPAT